jgi:hypothetical protein
MDQPRVDNQTDFAVHPQVLVDRDGEKLVAMVKATWELERVDDDELELAPVDRRRGLRAAEVPWGLPGETSPLLPPDFCVRKLGTDVVFAARGYAPAGKPAESFDVSFRAGPISKVLRVFGLRVWQAGGNGISAPRPIRSLDLRWEYAWGGLSMDDVGNVAEEPRNPLGRGIALDPGSLTHQAAPQIEDPFALISSVETRPAPAGVGPIMRHWEPRRSHYGTYDDKWLDERAPLTPPDEDDRAYNIAPPDMIAASPLLGGEEIALAGTVSGGRGVTFKLPRVAVAIAFAVEGQAKVELRPNLDTVVVDQLLGPKEGLPVVEMVWRAAIPAPRRMKDTTVTVHEVGVPR